MPNITFGPPVVSSIRRRTDHFLDVHLMIEDPDRYIEAFAEAGADSLTVHAEACRHLSRTLQQIKGLGLKAGAALNPHTPVHSIEWVLDELDLVLVMTVNPGFGGQHFLPAMLRKIREVKALIDERGCSARIQVDGGIDERTGVSCVDAGASVLVAGSSVFGSADPAAALRSLSSAVGGQLR